MGNWAYILLFLFGVVIILLWIKLGKKEEIEYFDQIKQNMDLTVKELEYNPTEIKFMKHLDKTYRVYGEFFEARVKDLEDEKKQVTFRKYTKDELRGFEIKNLRNKILGKKGLKVEIESHEFLVRRNYFNTYLLKIYHGEKDLIILKVGDFKKIKEDTIKVNDIVRLVYRDGFYVNSCPTMIPVISERTQRLMINHQINAVGQQQKDFSRIRSDWAHKELMKDKEIEAEEKKDKSKRHG